MFQILINLLKKLLSIFIFIEKFLIFLLDYSIRLLLLAIYCIKLLNLSKKIILVCIFIEELIIYSLIFLSKLLLFFLDLYYIINSDEFILDWLKFFLFIIFNFIIKKIYIFYNISDKIDSSVIYLSMLISPSFYSLPHMHYAFIIFFLNKFFIVWILIFMFIWFYFFIWGYCLGFTYRLVLFLDIIIFIIINLILLYMLVAVNFFTIIVISIMNDLIDGGGYPNHPGAIFIKGGGYW